MSRVAALDGLRALAVIAVMLEHSHLQFGHGGLFGVDVFFVLSGFLITGVLLGERERHGRISFRRFYARRVLRLYPALVVVLIVCTPVGWTLVPGHTWGDWFAAVAAAATYTSNFVILVNGQLTLGVLDPTWSLAIEEQFYLLWPVALMGLLALGVSARARIGIVLAVAAGGLSLFWITYHPLTGPAVPLDMSGLSAYVRPDARFGELLIGCALAMALAGRRGRPLPVWGERAMAGAVLVAIAGLWLSRELFVQTLQPGGGNPMAMIPVVAVCAGILVARIATGPRSWTARVLSLTPLPQIGLISYGLYLWHAPVFAVIKEDPFGLTGAEQLVQWALTFALAIASYLVVEQPFLRLKDRLRDTPVAGLQPAPAVVGAAAPAGVLGAAPAAGGAEARAAGGRPEPVAVARADE